MRREGCYAHQDGLARLASVASAAGVSALVPSAAQAHPCAVNVVAGHRRSCPRTNTGPEGRRAADAEPRRFRMRTSKPRCRRGRAKRRAGPTTRSRPPRPTPRAPTDAGRRLGRIPPPGTGNSLPDINSTSPSRASSRSRATGAASASSTSRTRPTRSRSTTPRRAGICRARVTSWCTATSSSVRGTRPATTSPNENPTCMGHLNRPRFRGRPHLGHLQPRCARVQEAGPHVGDRQRPRRPGSGLRRAHRDRRAG